MAFGKLGAMGRGFGTLGVLGTAGNSAPLWTPANLGSAVVAWWDGNLASSIVFFTAPSVSTWTDRVNGVVATYGGLNTATWSATARNGKGGFSANSGNSKYAFSAATFPSGFAASTVLVSTFTGASGNNAIAFSWGTAGSTTMRAFGKGTGDFGLFSSGAANQNTTENFYATDRCMISVLPAGATPTNSIYVDGNTAETLAYATQSTTTSNGFIGVWPDGTSFPHVGIIQQIVVMNRVATATELDLLAGWESWWTGKAGSNLPIGHPYKSHAPTAFADAGLSASMRAQLSFSGVIDQAA